MSTCDVMGIEHDDPPKCAQCGFTAYELEVMDFGPYVGQLICDECWNATEPPDGVHE